MRLFALLLLCAAATPAADRLVGGPYAVNPAARSATIGWLVESGEVRTGAAADQLSRKIPVLRSEKISMTGLKAGETVYYEIPGPGPVSERTGHFKIPPTSPVPFHFVVFGDTRTRHELHRKIVQAISKTEPDFVVHTGDLVTDGYDTEQWPLFFDIERDLLRKALFYAVLGNHERDNRRFYDYFDVKEPYSSFNWANAHFLLMDSDLNNVSLSAAERERFWNEQARWIEDDLQKSQKADFRFVVMHHPPITAHTSDPGHVSKDTPKLIAMFEKYKVSMVLAGHDHNYQHHIQNGIHYVVTGGGGAPLAPVENPIPGITKKVQSVEHFVQVRVDGKKAYLEAISLDGHVIETIEF